MIFIIIRGNSNIIIIIIIIVIIIIIIIIVIIIIIIIIKYKLHKMATFIDTKSTGSLSMGLVSQVNSCVQ